MDWIYYVIAAALIIPTYVVLILDILDDPPAWLHRRLEKRRGRNRTLAREQSKEIMNLLLQGYLPGYYSGNPGWTTTAVQEAEQWKKLKIKHSRKIILIKAGIPITDINKKYVKKANFETLQTIGALRSDV